MIDLGTLYSLKKDLERFWQCKAFKWEPMLRRQAAVEEARQYAPEKEEEETENKHARYALLEAQDLYVTLRRRILDQRETALDVIDFLGIDPPKHLLAINFAKPLPDNADIEEAIEELGVLAHYVTHLYYPMQTARFWVSSVYEWVINLIWRRK